MITITATPSTATATRTTTTTITTVTTCATTSTTTTTTPTSSATTSTPKHYAPAWPNACLTGGLHYCHHMCNYLHAVCAWRSVLVLVLVLVIVLVLVLVLPIKPGYLFLACTLQVKQSNPSWHCSYHYHYNFVPPCTYLHAPARLKDQQG
jgi:hypothetical protein